MDELKGKKTWAATFISVFVVAAFGFVFANAWNKVSEAVLHKYETKDKYGLPVKPVRQTLYYALAVTVMCAALLWFIYEYAISS